MDAKKVLAVLKQIEFGIDGSCKYCAFPGWMPHGAGCIVAALIAEAEQEAQTGGATITHLDTAAHQHVESMLPRADGTQGPYLWWHGWAIRDAFVAGAKWRAEQEAQTGGWNPGSEPPDHSRPVHLVLDTEFHADGKKRYGQTFGFYNSFSGLWNDYYGAVRNDVLFYYDAPPPPLPEQSEAGKEAVS